MLASFSVSNFRSIKNEVLLSFEAASYDDLADYYILRPDEKTRLLKLGIIYGANASGKTNLLKAIDFFRDLVLKPEEKKTDPIAYERFKFDNTSESDDSVFRIVFYTAGIKYEYSVQLNNLMIVEEALYFYAPNRAKIFSRETDKEKKLAKISFGSKIKLSVESKRSLESNILWNNTTLGGFLKTNIDFDSLNEVTGWFKDTLAGLITPRTNLLGYISSKIEKGEISKPRVVEILAKADFNITNILFEELEQQVPEPMMDFLVKKMPMDEETREKMLSTGMIKSKKITFEHLITGEGGDGGKYLLDFGEQSLGTQRFYQFAGLIALMINESKIFPIDELESSLHPDLIKHFIKTVLINTKSSQLIFTTHLRELLLERDILRNDAIYFVDKSEEGCTDLYSAEDFDSSSLRRKEGSLYNAYKLGKLGATPALNDTYIHEAI